MSSPVESPPPGGPDPGGHGGSGHGPPGAGPDGADPLLDALRAENERLRARNRQLTDQVAAMRRAQAVLAVQLRLTAPLRMLQERVRLTRTRRRRRRLEDASPLVSTPVPTSLAAAPEQLAAHPLLARTRRQLDGTVLTPADCRPLRTGRAGRVAVVAHVYYPELWPELADRIARIPRPVDLIVTLVEERSEAAESAVVARFPQARLVVVPNHGRDMWPFVRVLQLGLVGDQDAVLKLHTKASVHRVDGAAWRTVLLDSLCPTAGGVQLILELLDRDPTVGLVAAAGGVLGRELWGSNGPLLEALAIRAGVALDPDRTWFPSGSMFWARPSVLLPLRDAQLTADDFEQEALSIDGTTAHALERFVGVLAAAAGTAVVDADEVPGRLATARAAGRLTGPRRNG